jgi:hypothetical protein
MATAPLMFAQEDVEFGRKPSIVNDFLYNNNVMQAETNIRMGRYMLSHFHIFSSDMSLRAHKNVLSHQVPFYDRKDLSST